MDARAPVFGQIRTRELRYSALSAVIMPIFPYSPDEEGPTASVWNGDLFPHDGGIDQNIYGETTPK
jgi:hypothetical protein